MKRYAVNGVIVSKRWQSLTKTSVKGRVKNLSRESDFYIRRLHSLLGIIPVGLFVAQHLVINHFATRGPEAFNAASDFMGNLPFVLFLEWFIIYIPLMFHAFYGLYIAFTAKNNVKRYGTFRNWMFMFQRITGVFLLSSSLGISTKRESRRHWVLL